MSVRDALDADVGVLAQRGRDFLGWWGGELADMAKPLLRPSGGGRAGLAAERGRDGVYRLYRHGEAIGEHRAGDKPIRAALTLPSDAALVQHLWRPLLSERDLVRMTVLDMDRLTPFTRNEVYYDIVIAPKAEGADQRQVRLAVAPRTVADACLELAALEGVEPLALIADTAEGPIDFLPAVRQRNGGGATTPRLEHPIAWGLVAALLAANVALAVWRDVQATNTIQGLVATQAPVVQRVQLASRRVAQLQADAAAQAGARRRGEPLRILEAASAALPDGAWVQRLSWDGQELRLTGQAKPGVDVLAGLKRAPLLADAHAIDAASTAVPAFDVAARIPVAGRAP
jgi:hypothetical protein